VKDTQAYRFALDLTPRQERACRSHAGAARFAWNWGLAKCKERYQAGGGWYSAAELHKVWNARKKADPALAWWTTRNGGRLIKAGRWFPSSRACSGCGAVKTKLTLSERTYLCGTCGLVLDRDVNAAVNLLKLAASGAERLNACGGTVRPGLAGHGPVKQEPGTSHEGQTGTAAGQPAAANKELTHAH